jgi:hypothetical protein
VVDFWVSKTILVQFWGEIRGKRFFPGPKWSLNLVVTHGPPKSYYREKRQELGVSSKVELEGRALVHDGFRFTLKMSGTRKKNTPEIRSHSKI